MPANSELARLLEHPAIWRGTSVAHAEVHPTGFGVLDERLPGKGWPRSGLIEILVPRFGVGELSLLLPTLATLTRRPMARWCVWVAPPLEPFAPALAAHGVVLERVLVVRAPVAEATITSVRTTGRPGREGECVMHAEAGAARAMGSPVRESGSATRAGVMRNGARRKRVDGALWAFEQSLASGACDMAMAWIQHPRPRDIRRLQLAAERGRALGVLFRPAEAAQHSSHAALRLTLEPTADGVRATLLKSRGGIRGSVEFPLQTAGS